MHVEHPSDPVDIHIEVRLILSEVQCPIVVGGACYRTVIFGGCRVKCSASSKNLHRINQPIGRDDISVIHPFDEKAMQEDLHARNKLVIAAFIPCLTHCQLLKSSGIIYFSGQGGSCSFHLFKLSH